MNGRRDEKEKIEIHLSGPYRSFADFLPRTRAFQFAIRIDSIRFFKSAFRFTSCHAVFLAYLLYSLSQKNKLMSLFAAFNTLKHRQKQLRNAYYKNYS